MVNDDEGKPLSGWEKLMALGGGSFQPGENFEVEVLGGEKGAEPTLKLKFRGQDIDLDMKRFSELVELYKQSKEKKK